MKKIYTVHVPVEEIWVMEVEAESRSEALKKVKENHPDSHQMHSIAGSTPSGDTEIVDVREVDET